MHRARVWLLDPRRSVVAGQARDNSLAFRTALTYAMFAVETSPVRAVVLLALLAFGGARVSAGFTCDCVGLEADGTQVCCCPQTGNHPPGLQHLFLPHELYSHHLAAFSMRIQFTPSLANSFTLDTHTHTHTHTHLLVNMPPRRRTAAADALPFSPGQQSTESFMVRKQQATSWALDGLASSPELAQWGDQLHSKLRHWQRAFTMAMVALTIAVSVLGYQTAVYHSGSALSTPFKESFDKLSGNSQQALQQLVTQGSKLIPEGSSIRDSYDKLSVSSQHALYHLVNSGLSLPSLLPHKKESKVLLSTSNADSTADKASIAQLTTDLRSARQENEMLTDLLQRSQEELSVSQSRTHELLTSLARVEDNRSLLASQNAYLQSVNEKVPEAKECAQQMPACDEAPQCPVCDDVPCTESLYGPFGSQGWLLGALAAAFLLFTGFLYSPGSALRPFKAVYRSCFPPKAKLHQASPAKESPANGLSGPSTPRTLESESVESEADMREQIEALRAVATQRDGLEKDLKVVKADLSTTQGKLAETTASLDSVKADLVKKTRHASQLESQLQVAQDKAADSRADAVAAQNNLDAAEHKVAELTDSLASAQASHGQAVDELQHQHLDDIRAIETQLAQVKSDKAMAESSLNEKLAELAELTQQLTETRLVLAAADVIIEQTKAEAERLSSELATATTKQAVEATVHQVDVQQQQQALTAAAAANEAAEAAIEQARVDAELQSRDLADASSAKEAAESALEQAKADAGEHKQDLADAISAKESVQADLEQAQTELLEQGKALADVTAAREAAEANSGKAQANAEQLQQTLAEVTSARNSAQESLQQTQADIEQQAQALTEAIAAKDNAEASLEEVSASAEQLEQSLAEAVHARESAEAVLEQTRAGAKRQKQELADAAASAKEVADASLQQLKADVKQQKQELADAKSATDSAEAAVKQLRADAKRQKQDLASATSAKDRVGAFLERAKSELERQQQVTKDATSAKASLQAALDKATADAKQHQQALQEVTFTKDAAEAAVEQAHARAQQQEQLVADVSSAKASLHAELQQAKADAKDHQYDLANVTFARESAEASSKQAKADAQEQQQAVADANSAKANLQASLEQAMADAEQQRQFLADLKTGKGSNEEALQQSSAECSRLAAQLGEAISARTAAEAAVAEKSDDVRTLRAEVAETHRACEHLQKVINGFHADLESSVSAVQVQSLQNDLAGANAHIQSLLSQMHPQQEPGRLQVQTGPRAMMPSNSIPGTPRRSPGSPTGSSRSSGSRGSRPTDFLTQLTDAQKRITTLEAELAAAKVTGSSAIPAPCLRCLSRDPVFHGMLAQINRQPSTFSQAWKGTGEYNEVRSKAFASFVNHSGGTPRKAAASASASLPSHAVEVGPEVSSHAIEGTGDLASHAVQDAHESIPSHALEDEGLPSYALEHDVGSPQSSVGSWRGRLDMRINLDNIVAPESTAVSPRLSSPLRSLAGQPLSGSTAHLASGFDTARTPLSSHAVNPSSSSGSGTDEGFTPTSMQQEATGTFH
ncbi:hypothetical protein WJX77_008167 [Trebouxia sp. C0004]